MLWASSHGTLEIRSEGGSTRLRAVFPYGARTELAPGREEVIAARAFTIDGPVHLLSGHDYEKPLASTEAGNLSLSNGDDALEIEATLDADTTWARDFLAAHKAGLIRGLSPGFRVPVGGDRVTRSGDGGILRTITKADLFEVSTVNRVMARPLGPPCRGAALTSAGRHRDGAQPQGRGRRDGAPARLYPEQSSRNPVRWVAIALAGNLAGGRQCLRLSACR